MIEPAPGNDGNIPPLSDPELSALLDHQSLPLIEGALDLAEMGIIPAGAYSNREYLEQRVLVDAGVPLAITDLCFDPQTSGGLLLAVGADQAEALLTALQAEIPEATCIGTFLPRAQREIELV